MRASRPAENLQGVEGLSPAFWHSRAQKSFKFCQYAAPRNRSSSERPDLRSAGVDNALRLLHKLNRSDIPVAFQEGYLGSTLLNLDYPNGMPPQIWTEASTYYLKRWIATEPSPKPAAWQTAPQLILQILDRAPNNSVHILELGPYTNLAAALHRSGGAELFRSKVKRLYVQGGKVPGSHVVDHSGAGPNQISDLF